MTQNLINFLNGAKNKEFATKMGTAVHALLQHVIIDGAHTIGDKNMTDTIKKHPELHRFFGANAQTEVPIAGNINGKFISRRIDRLLINHDTKTIDFIDYKTDTDKKVFLNQYKIQLQEYAKLLHSAYPDYKINGYILWTQDWALDKII